MGRAARTAISITSRRRLIQTKGAETALARRAVGPVLHHLPVPACHAVLAHEQRLAGEHADPPVELGRQKLLRQHEVGLLEQFARDAGKLGGGLDFVHAARKRTVGDFHHHRQSQLVDGFGEIGVFREDDGRRRRHLMLLQQLHQKDFVGAADHGDRIVDHRHAFLPGAAREPVGVIVDRRGLADEQAVEFREPGKLALCDRLHVHRHPVGDAGEMPDRGRRRRRGLFVGIVQHRQIVFGDRACLRVAPFAPGVIVQRLAEKLGLAVGKPRDVARPDAVDRQPVARLDGHFQRRAPEHLEQQPPERFEPAVARETKTDQQLEFRPGLKVGTPGAAVQLLLEVRQRVLVKFLLAQLEHGLDSRHHAVPARLGEQRGIITLRLVGVGAGEVDKLRPPHLEQTRTRQVFGRGDDLMRRLGVWQITGLVNKDDPPGHGWVPFQPEALSKGRPVIRAGSEARHVLVIANNEPQWRQVHRRCPPSKPIRAAESGGSVTAAKQLFEPQRSRMIVIVIRLPAKQPVAGFFVARNRPRVVLVDFKPHRANNPAPAPLFRRQTEAAAPRRADRYGARPRSNRAARCGSAGETGTSA